MADGTTRRFGAPGRVNLIGGHVDHHDGLVVTMAIDLGLEAEVVPREGPVAVLRSDHFEGEVELPIDGSLDPSRVEPEWGRLVGGVFRAMREQDVAAGAFDATITSTLPVGAGLSSSAAFEVLVGMVAVALAGTTIASDLLVDVAQRAEHLASGVPCGIQDQTSIVHGGVLVLDVRDRSVEPLALPPGSSVVVVDSAVPRALEHTPFAELRGDALAAATRLGVVSLRHFEDANPTNDRSERARVHERLADEPRARHVVSEIGRVVEFAEAFRAGDVERAGRLMVASHHSSRDDYGSSVPELDLLVEELLAAGAYGARLTGGGFGGCVVGLVAGGAASSVGERVVDAYAEATGRRAVAHVVRPAPGAAERPT